VYLRPTVRSEGTKFNIIETIKNNFFDDNGAKLEIQQQKKI
jgi:hypothetical protein